MNNYPRNVRNFWIELNVDGRKSKVATGPIGKHGGFSMEIYIRERGRVQKAFTLVGNVDGQSVKIHKLNPNHRCLTDDNILIEARR